MSGAGEGLVSALNILFLELVAGYRGMFIL